MKLAVFGASGGTGRELVKQALARAHHVTAFVRRPDAFDLEDADLTVEQGDVTAYAAVERAVEGREAALCALGASTPLRRDPDLIDGVGTIVRAMERSGVARLVYLSFLGVRGAESS